MSEKEKLKNRVPRLPISIGTGSVPENQVITEWLVDGEVVHVGQSWTPDARHVGKTYKIRLGGVFKSTPPRGAKL